MPETRFETDAEGRVFLDGVVPSDNTELSVTHPAYNRLTGETLDGGSVSFVGTKDIWLIA